MTTPTERALALMRSFTSVAMSVVELPYGQAVAHPGLPHYSGLNHLRVQRGTADAATLIVDADRYQAGLPAQLIVVEPEDLAERLTGDLAAAGFELKRKVCMAFEGPTPARGDARVEALDPTELLDLHGEWMRAETPDAREIADVIEAAKLIWAAVPTRAFCVCGIRGAPIAMAHLMGEGATQMVEDVYTTPDHRGAGLGALLVGHAVAVARQTGASLVIVPTEAGGRARGLYERVGFRELCRTARFQRHLR